MGERIIMKIIQNTAISIVLALLSSFAILGCSPASDSGSTSNSKDGYDTENTRSMISGIRSIPEVAWAERNKNTLYVGLKEVSADMKDMAHAWALQLNREWDFGAHVWMLPETAGPSTDPDVGKIYYEVSARHGKID